MIVKIILSGAALDDQHKKNVYSVAKQLNTTATSVRAKFLINTGDNFYWCGIQNTSDFQIQTDFLEPYDYPSLKLKWYSSLGVTSFVLTFNSSREKEKNYCFNRITSMGTMWTLKSNTGRSTATGSSLQDTTQRDWSSLLEFLPLC